MNVRRRGAAYEREIAKDLKARGYDARRGQQFCGASGDADVIGLPGVHIECKRTNRLRLYEALQQSIDDARPGEIPTVWHRSDGNKTVVILRESDFLDLYERAHML